MVKNTRGGNKTKKMSSKIKTKDMLPQEQELRTKNMFVIGKIVEIFNNHHVNVVTMDSYHFKVFCSATNNVSRLQRDSFVLLYFPHVEYHFKKSLDNEKYKSIIVAVLDNDKLNTLTTKYKYEFLNEEKTKSSDISNSIMFEQEDKSVNSDDDEIDITLI